MKLSDFSFTVNRCSAHNHPYIKIVSTNHYYDFISDCITDNEFLEFALLMFEEAACDITYKDAVGRFWYYLSDVQRLNSEIFVQERTRVYDK